MTNVPPITDSEPADEPLAEAVSDEQPGEQSAAATSSSSESIPARNIAESDIGSAVLPDHLVSVPSLNLDRRRLVSDAVAGATFAAVNIPQSLGHGQIAGVNPVFALYTLMFAMPVAAIFTGSVFMNVSTTSSLAVATQSALSPARFYQLPPNRVVELGTQVTI